MRQSVFRHGTAGVFHQCERRHAETFTGARSMTRISAAVTIFMGPVVLIVGGWSLVFGSALRTNSAECAAVRLMPND